MAYNDFTREGGSWDNAHESTANVVAPRLTLGQVIDGYLHLTESEKQIFAVACLGSVSGQTASVPGATAPVGPGQTRDPKTGKVFKITPKREHTPARKARENGLANAKRAFSELLRAHGLVLDENRNLPPEVPADVRQQAIALYKAIESAKDSLAEYKSAHPEEFLPPPNKKTGQSSRQVMANQAPAPKGPSPPPNGGVQVKPPTPPVGGASSSKPAAVAAPARQVGSGQKPPVAPKGKPTT